MGEQVLLVDDEPRLLDGLRRTLRGGYVVSTAGSGAEGLGVLTESVQQGNPFAVVVSDMMMPEMSGSQFLTQARQVVPDAVLMILSGQADLTSTISAVNNANLFRFLTKPCAPDDFTRALDAALRQHQLVLAERELLEHTLTGTIDVLTDVLAMASPGVSWRTDRMRSIMRATAEMLGLDDDWRLAIAAMLSHLGCVAMPARVIDKLDLHRDLEPAEAEMWRAHPQIARTLLAPIPRLEQVAEWIGNQPTSEQAAEDPGPGPSPGDDVAACVLPTVAAFLVCHDAREDLTPGAKTAPRDILRRLTETGRYPEAVLEAVLAAVCLVAPRGVVALVTVTGLMPGMVIHQDVSTTAGLVLVRAGARVTDLLILRLINFSRSVGVQQPFQVLTDR